MIRMVSKAVTHLSSKILILLNPLLAKGLELTASSLIRAALRPKVVEIRHRMLLAPTRRYTEKRAPAALLMQPASGSEQSWQHYAFRGRRVRSSHMVQS